MSILAVAGKFSLVELTTAFLKQANNNNDNHDNLPTNHSVKISEEDVKVIPHPEKSASNVAEILQTFPRGAYTGCRTVAGLRWLSFDFHAIRLVNSTIGIFFPDNKSNFDIPASTNAIQIALLAMARRAVRELGQSDSEVKITVHIIMNRCKFEGREGSFHIDTIEENPNLQTIWLCASSLPKMRPAVEVKVSGVPRENPTIKDTKWVVERQGLEKLITGNVNEVLLVSHQGEISEGLSSNFFVVHKNGTIYTAPDHFCLLGSIREIVLKICENEKISLEKKAPNLHKDAPSWVAAFVTSTSRLVLPVSRIEILPSEHIIEGRKELVFASAENSTICKLQKLLEEDIKKNSTPIF